MTEITADMAGRRKVLGFTMGYWMLNVIEMFERLAYYSVRSVVALYIMQADDPHGLHFTAADKGTIYAFWFAFQSILPTFTGGFADRYGTAGETCRQGHAGHELHRDETHAVGFVQAVNSCYVGMIE